MGGLRRGSARRGPWVLGPGPAPPTHPDTPARPPPPASNPRAPGAGRGRPGGCPDDAGCGRVRPAPRHPTHRWTKVPRGCVTRRAPEFF